MVLTSESENELNACPPGADVALSALDIDLDPYNPRLTDDERGESQSALLEIMIRRFKIDDLASAIVATGFLEFDPLVGLWADGHVVVLEGNRRIAAAKLLLSPELAPRRLREKWQRFSKQLDSQYRQQLEHIRIRIYKSRDQFDVLAYIGFRHVSGVLQWPSLEKAAFIGRLVDDEGWTYQQISNRLGSYPKHIERHYVAHRIIEQARQESVPGYDRMEAAFGVLLRALQSTDIQEFLGVTYPGDPDLSERPIPEENQTNFRDFVRWTFGTGERSRVLKDSRHLTRWGKILLSSEAVGYLRRTPDPSFDRAWIKSGGQAESVIDALLTAADRLEESVPLVLRYREDADVQEAADRCRYFLDQIVAALRGSNTRQSDER